MRLRCFENQSGFWITSDKPKTDTYLARIKTESEMKFYITKGMINPGNGVFLDTMWVVRCL